MLCNSMNEARANLSAASEELDIWTLLQPGEGITSAQAVKHRMMNDRHLPHEGSGGSERRYLPETV
jgi:hypothetical protein